MVIVCEARPAYVYARELFRACAYASPPSALSLGRRQSQRRGVGGCGRGVRALDAPVAPQAYLGAGEKALRSRGLQV